MDTLARTCGWCGSTTLDASLTHCAPCGGPLPAPRPDPTLPVGLGPPPPPAPRTLPPAFRRDVLVWKNVLVIIGGIFTFAFGWTLIFGLIGAPMLYIGWTRAKRRLLVLERGTPVPGRVTEVDRDTSVKINNKSPWIIRFRYTGPQGQEEGWVHAWKRPELREDDASWVLMMPEDPKAACLWPPVK